MRIEPQVQRRSDHFLHGEHTVGEFLVALNEGRGGGFEKCDHMAMAQQRVFPTMFPFQRTHNPLKEIEILVYFGFTLLLHWRPPCRFVSYQEVPATGIVPRL